MQILGYTPQRNNRFYTGSDRAFGGEQNWDQYSWTGVPNIFGGGAMISPSFGITCSHGGDFTGSTLTFWLNNSGTAGTITRTVKQVWLNVVGGHDVALFQLDSPLPNTIQPFAIGSGYSGLLGTEVVAYAGGLVGRNTLAANYNTGSFLEEWESAYNSYGFNPDEFQYQGGDSGGPLFTVVAGQLVLIGEHHADPGNVLSFDSSCSASDVLSAIQTIVTSAGESMTVVSLPSPPAPSAPTGLVATPGSGQVSLSWGAVQAATNSYNLYRGTVSGGEVLYRSGLASNPLVASVTFTDTGVTNGTTYFYKVTGVNDGGEGSLSSEASATPRTAIPVLQGKPYSTANLLSWSASGGATSYKVYRSLSSGSETLLASGITATNWPDLFLTNNTTYFYKVTAIGPDGETALSNEVSLTPQGGLGSVSNFTEFYSVSGGDNLSAGSTNTGSTTTYTSAGGDSDGTSVFTPNDGSTPANTVSVGMWGSVYVTAGATTATFVGRVTAVAAGVNGAITFSTTAKAGAFPGASAGAHTITCKIGGAWGQPSGSSTFPAGSFFKSTLTDAAGHMPRFNCSGTWSMTATINTPQGPYRIEGMTASPGDGGRLTIDAGGSAISILSLNTTSPANVELVNVTIQNNTGSSHVGLTIPGVGCVLKGVVVTNIAGNGVSLASNPGHFENCEFANCNTSNTAGQGGVAMLSSQSSFRNCSFHDNAGNANNGAVSSSNSTSHIFINCLFFNNGLTGVLETAAAGTPSHRFINCDFYNNPTGFNVTVSTGSVLVSFDNCNFVKNSTNGVNASSSGSGFVNLRLTNCGFGSGGDANGTDVVAASTTIFVENTNPVSYTAPTNPWADPANGDFRIVSPQAQQLQTPFTLTQGGLSKTTTGYFDVGAAPHQKVNMIF